jgi:hypothetical protein
MGMLGIVEVMNIMCNPDSSKSKCSQYDQVINPCQENSAGKLLQPSQINTVFKPGRKAMAG